MELETKEVESEYKASVDEKGNVVLKRKEKINIGRKARASGAGFELRVRNDLNEKKWVVDKWSNNVDLISNEIVPAKRKFNPFSKVMTIGTGFPDFIAFQLVDEKKYNVIGVEVKLNGILSKIEKEKCAFLLKNRIFNDIWIAKKKKAGRKIEIEYDDFKERYNKFLD